MKKFLCTILIVASIFNLSMITTLATQPIKLVVAGETINTDVAPIIVNDRVMIPVRAVFESIGAKVSYDASAQLITATKRDRVIQMSVGNNVMLVDNKEVELEVAPFVRDDRTLVPVRACAEAFDLNVQWLQESRTVKVLAPTSVLSKEIESDGSWTTFSYDEKGRLVRIQEYTKDGENKYFEEYTYDNNGNVLSHRMAGPSFVKYFYDDAGKLIREEKADYLYGDSTVTYTYNDKGLLIYVEDTLSAVLGEKGSWCEYKYDENGRLIYERDKKGHVLNYSYDQMGNLKTIEQEERKTEYFYDSQCRLIREEITYGNSVKDWREYEYDAAGNLTYEGHYENSKETRWYKYEFDSDGKLIYKRWYENLQENWIKHTYNEEGNLILQEWSSGGSKRYFYNVFGDLIEVSFPNGIIWEQYEYDDNGNLLKYSEPSRGTSQEYIVVVK